MSDSHYPFGQRVEEVVAEMELLATVHELTSTTVQVRQDGKPILELHAEDHMATTPEERKASLKPVIELWLASS